MPEQLNMGEGEGGHVETNSEAGKLKSESSAPKLTIEDKDRRYLQSKQDEEHARAHTRARSCLSGEIIRPDHQLSEKCPPTPTPLRTNERWQENHTNDGV